MKKIILAAAALAATSVPAFAAGNTATGAGVATATVIAPISITHTAGASLAFGSFTTGTGGTVVVSSAGAGSVTGDVTFVTGSTNSADSFAVAGDPGRSFTISTASGTVTSGASTIAFTTSPSAASATLDASGARTFTVGGTLTLVGTEAAGAYTGSYDATVTYN